MTATLQDKLREARATYPVGKSVRYYPAVKVKNRAQYLKRLVRRRAVISGNSIIVNITDEGDVSVERLEPGWPND